MFGEVHFLKNTFMKHLKTYLHVNYLNIKSIFIW